MDAARLRACFARDAAFHWPGEWPLSAELAGAAVLIALVPGVAGFDILLTRRTDHLYHHPGQISFPGGRVEAEDPTPRHAALREAEEEIGLAPVDVEVLGELPAYATVTGFRILPVVGLVRGEPALKLDRFEVAEVFRLPLGAVLDPARFQLHRVERAGTVRHFHAIPHAGRFIWGATAGMLAMLAAFVSYSAGGDENGGQ